MTHSIVLSYLPETQQFLLNNSLQALKNKVQLKKKENLTYSKLTQTAAAPSCCSHVDAFMVVITSPSCMYTLRICSVFYDVSPPKHMAEFF